MNAATRVGGARRLHRPDLVLAVFAVAAGGAVGAAGARSIQLGVIAIVFLSLALLAARRPVTLAIAALIGVYAVQRLGGSSISPGSSGGVSYSDALVTAAAFLAVPALVGTPELRRLRGAMLGLGSYLACLLPTIFINPSHRAYLEWAHRAVIVGGALLVGAWIVREGRTRVALRWLTFVSCLVAVAALQDTFRHALHPASPFGLNKNFVGALLASTLIVVLVAAKEIQLPVRIWIPALVLIGSALIASQSRGGMLAAALGLLIAFVLDPRAHRRGVKLLVIALAGALAWIVYSSVTAQLNQTKADINTGSLGVRFNVEQVTRDIWRTSPTVGVGLKYFNSGDYGFSAVPANNDIDNELAESGVIGVIGFVVLQGAALGAGVRRRKGDPLAIAAVGVVAGQLLHGMVDIYWTGGTISLAFMILGLGLARAPAGATDAEREVQQVPVTVRP